MSFFKIKISVILIFLNFLCLSTGINKVYSDEGETFYKTKKYKKALNHFLDKQIDNPNLPELKYNTANTYYNLGDFNNAEKEYLGVLKKTKDKDLKQQAYFNLGNTYYKQGKLNESLEFYKKSLEINQADKDTKYNIEFVKREIEKRKEQQQKQEDKNQESEDKGQKQEDKKQKQEDKKHGQDDKKQNQESEAGTKDQEDKKSEKSVKEGKPLEEMSEKEAMKWLDKVKEDRRKFIQMQMKKKGPGRSPQNDW